jgi:hypothetical protein
VEIVIGIGCGVPEDNDWTRVDWRFRGLIAIAANEGENVEGYIFVCLDNKNMDSKKRHRLDYRAASC